MSKARGLADLGNAFSDGALSNRNLIINGAMQVAQRGTSFSNTTGYQIDRWFVANPGTNTVSQVFDTTLNMYCMSVTQSVGYGTVYKIEDKDVKHLKAGDVVTLSYWINVTSGDFKISTNATSQVSVSTTTIDTATGWYRRSASYTLTSAEVAAITGGSYLQINIEPAALAYKLTGVQLEVGDTATPFEHRSYGDELQRCQRYFEIVKPETGQQHAAGIAVGYNLSTTEAAMHYFYKVRKRTEPDFTVTGQSNIRINHTGVSRNISSGSIIISSSSGVDTARMILTGASGSMGDGDGSSMSFVGDGSLQFNAEL